ARALEAQSEADEVGAGERNRAILGGAEPRSDVAGAAYDGWRRRSHLALARRWRASLDGLDLRRRKPDCAHRSFRAAIFASRRVFRRRSVRQSAAALLAHAGGRLCA